MPAEFRDFVARGKVLDLAVAVIIGPAFATITGALAEDVIMPLVEAVLLADHYAALKEAGALMLGWGSSSPSSS